MSQLPRIRDQKDIKDPNYAFTGSDVAWMPERAAPARTGAGIVHSIQLNFDPKTSKSNHSLGAASNYYSVKLLNNRTKISGQTGYFDYIQFKEYGVVEPNSSLYAPGGSFFAIAPAKVPLNGSKSTIRYPEGYNVRAAASYKERVGGDYPSYYTIAYDQPWKLLSGISIETLPRGNDLILPSGSGSQRSQGTFETVVDRGQTFVNIHNGQDAIIGGYDRDHFGARDVATLSALLDPKKSVNTTTTGSKFFVGGSFSDVLDGGNSNDYLNGDRYGGLESYLPTSVIEKNFPAGFDVQLNALKGYQPERFRNGESAGHALVTRGQYRLGRQYPLYYPGNDVIRAYEGDDILVGDNNDSDSNLAVLAEITRLRDSITGDLMPLSKTGLISKENWTKQRLGADFLDAGPGNDQILAGFGSDAIIGGLGSDVIDIGDQIIAPNYNPFYGVKVVYGDRAEYNGKAWVSDPNHKFPDAFILGGLYTQESEIKANATPATAALLEASKFKDQLAGFRTEWEKYKNLVKAIPKAGTVIEGIISGFLNFTKISEPNPPATGVNPTPLDGLVVIKDFDPFDTITFTLAKGEDWAAKYTDSYNPSTTGDSNPLIGKTGSVKGPGTFLTFGKTPSDDYKRVFIQDYVSGVVTLSDKTDPNTLVRTVTLGGVDFYKTPNDPTDPNSAILFTDLQGRSPTIPLA